MNHNRYLVTPLAKLLHLREDSVEKAWRLSKKTATMEGRKKDWFLVLRLTLRMLNKGIVQTIPDSCFNRPRVSCLGIEGTVVECGPVWFKIESDEATHLVPLFALIL